MKKYIIDANIIFSALISGKELFIKLFETNKFYAPDFIMLELDKYKSNDIHIKIARELAERGMFRPGDSIEYVIVDETDEGLVGSPIIEGEPFPKITRRGYEYYWSRILSTAERVLGEKIDPFSRSLKDWT